MENERKSTMEKMRAETKPSGRLEQGDEASAERARAKSSAQRE